MPRKIIIPTEHAETGDRVTFRLFRDERKPACWMLEDDTGYLRTLAPTYAQSLPKVFTVIENHGCRLLRPLN